MQPVFSAMEESPIIAAIRDPARWEQAVQSSAPVLFLLCGDIMNVRQLTGRAKAAGKKVFVHLELLSGIGRDNRAIDFIAEEARPAGVISTRSAQIRYAKERGLATVQRFFLVDSQSVATAVDTARSIRPDYVELMPGIMPEVIRKLHGVLDSGIIAGGLIETMEQAMVALSAGAGNVSTSCEALWEA